jgi:hypothetical protein
MSTRSTTRKENDGQEKKKDVQDHYLFIVIFFTMDCLLVCNKMNFLA